MERLERIWRVTVLAICASALLMAGSAQAQDSRGTISGTVRDSSKGLVPGATVTVTSKEMGNPITTVTNAEGFFQVPYLIAGSYKIAVELQGFKSYVREGIERAHRRPPRTQHRPRSGRSRRRGHRQS